jgi:hypothetical protein
VSENDALDDEDVRTFVSITFAAALKLKLLV